MKNIYSFLIIFFFLSCSNRKEYSAEKYEKMQGRYENLKIEFSKSLIDKKKKKENLFKENRSLLISLVQLIGYLEDTTTRFEDVNSDTTFFKKDEVLDPVNFGIKVNRTINGKNVTNESTLPISNVIFLNHGKVDDLKNPFYNYLKNLKNCLALDDDEKCLEIKTDKLQSILDIKYAFVVRQLLRMEPKLKGKTFDGGLYAADIICYDIESRSPIYSFRTIAQSSDEINFSKKYGQSPQQKILKDFNSNIKNEMLKSCKKHFKFVDGTTFIFNF